MVFACEPLKCDTARFKSRRLRRRGPWTAEVWYWLRYSDAWNCGKLRCDTAGIEARTFRRRVPWTAEVGYCWRRLRHKKLRTAEVWHWVTAEETPTLVFACRTLKN